MKHSLHTENVRHSSAKIINVFFSSKLGTSEALLEREAVCCGSANFVICRLKFSLSSMCTPKNFTDDEFLYFYDQY